MTCSMESSSGLTGSYLSVVSDEAALVTEIRVIRGGSLEQNHMCSVMYLVSMDGSLMVSVWQGRNAPLQLSPSSKHSASH